MRDAVSLFVTYFYPLLIACLSAACAKPLPLTPPPEAGDAAPVPPSGDLCQAGCAALASDSVRCALGDGGTDCAAFLRTIEEAGKERNPATGFPLRCADVAAVRTRADAVRIGFACPP